jgi:hypothetical protein
MKKIIALAVAGAFIAPAYAADVTITGDVEFIYASEGGALSGSTGDADFAIVGSEELNNGMTVTATLDIEDADMTGTTGPDAKLALSGAFGTVEFGRGASEATGAFEDAADVAEYGAGAEIDDNHTTDTSVDYRGTIAEGVTVALSYGIDNDGVASGAETTAVAYGVKYAVGNYSIAYASIDVSEADTNPSSMAATATFGPVYVGIERIANNGGDEAEDLTSMGLTYSYGPGKVYYESNNYADTSAESDVIAYGVSYKLAGVVNTYLGVVDTDGSSDNETVFGIEYSF